MPYGVGMVAESYWAARQGLDAPAGARKVVDRDFTSENVAHRLLAPSVQSMPPLTRST
jgi:hypothetical protein